ncbi:hypothetical protein [Microbacterium sp.]|uniref:hypothetical protein n=1 Tax=Microbacterium sp. TaxID=51671 RepID=UPI003F99F8A5
MQGHPSRTRRKLLRIAGSAALVLVFVIVIWIDLTTGVWQQAVILSGIAAGVLTFLLTALFFERWMSGADHRRWYPVTHLALTDLLHTLGDEERSQLSRGVIVARAIDDAGDHAQVLEAIHSERRTITQVLVRWAGFLAASADVQGIMDHIAALALRLDAARDAVLEAEVTPENADAQAAMRASIEAANASIRGAVDEIEAVLHTFAKKQA